MKSDENLTSKSPYTPPDSPLFCQLPSERAKGDVDMLFHAMRENHKEQKEVMSQRKTLMEGQQKLMEKMLEVDTAKFRRLELPPPILNSTALNSDDHLNSETDNNNIQTHQNISMNEFNETFRNLTQTLESKKNISKLNIK